MKTDSGKIVRIFLAGDCMLHIVELATLLTFLHVCFSLDDTKSSPDNWDPGCHKCRSV